MLDLARLSPEARRVVEPAAQIYIEHTDPWFVGLVMHGSALKGGYIPRSSDVDLMLYLKRDAFAPEGHLSFDLAARIQLDLCRVSPAPFRYIQCYAYNADAPSQAIGPIPGAYHVLAGRLPVPEATPEQLVQEAHRFFAHLDPAAQEAADAKVCIMHGDGRLDRNVRYLSTVVSPVAHHVLSLLLPDAAAAWRLPKPEAIPMLPDPLRSVTVRYYEAVRTHYDGGEQVATGINLLRQGHVLLRAAKAWYNVREGLPPDYGREKSI